MNRTILFAICLILALIIGAFFSWPKYQDLSSLQEKIKLKRTELQYKEEYFSNLKSLSEELKKYSENLSKIDSALPPDPSLPTLLEFLQKYGSENGLVLKKIGPVTSASLKDRERLKEHQLSLSFSGSYSSLKNFLPILEKTSRLIELESISFTSPEKKEETFSFNLTIIFYSY